MESLPRVSVVLPVLNAEPFVGEAVESVLAQSLGDFELIAIDDGSTDGSCGILEGFAARDNRVRLIARENRGHAATLNEGILLAKAAYVAIMNADDVALPERLEKQAAFLDANPRVAAVGSQTVFFAEGGTSTPKTNLPLAAAALRRFQEKTSPLSHPSVMFRRQAVIDAGLYRPQMWPADDYDLWLRLSEQHDLANLPDVLLRYRLHANQSTAHCEEAVAVATLVAQAASRERRAGRPDPIDGMATLSSDLIRRLDIQKNALARQILVTCLSRAETLLVVSGSASQAFGVLETLEGHWATLDQPRLWAACGHWLGARAALRQERLAVACRAFLTAVVADRSFAGRLIRAISRRVVPRGHRLGV